MNILILEDEKAAAGRLQKMLQDVKPGAQVLAVHETVREAAAWLKKNPAPDLILSDIQLADGLSFEVFDKVDVTAPIIFTTAYDAYMLKAFKLNSIDYLLKPIDKEELAAAFKKHETLHANHNTNTKLYELLRQLPKGGELYRSRFLIKQGDRLSYVQAGDVAFIRADDKVVFMHTADKKYIIDDTLDELERSLDPGKFFRINRSYIMHISAISKIHTHFNGRLKIELHNCTDNDIFVSRQRVNDFKEWLNR